MIARVVLGLIAVALGGIWIAQGTGVYPVGFMANQVEWAWAGMGVMLAGLLLIASGLRRRRTI